MNDHYTLEDADFENQFANGTLEPALFSHEAHLRLAWIHIRNEGVDKAIDTICFQLLNFVERAGATDKYNKTVTIAAIRAVYHFMLKSRADTFKEFIAANPRLKINFKELLGYHYTTNIFTAASARQVYLEPELLPFD